jgi:hypothetical protein
MMTFGFLFFGVAFLSWLILIPCIQRIENRAVPYAQAIFFRDKTLNSLLIIFFLFALLSSSDGFVINIFTQAPLIATLFSFLLMPIFLLMYFDRLLFLATGQGDLEELSKKVLRACSRGDLERVFKYLDSLIEVIHKAIHRKNMTLAMKAYKKLLDISEAFVHMATTKPIKEGDPTTLDKVNFFSAFLSKRLLWLFEVALKEHMEPLAEETISTFAKITLYFARCHQDLSHLPLLFIERTCREALQANQEEVTTRGCQALAELAKSLIMLSKEKNESFKELIFLVLSHLDEILKEWFKRNKELSPALLMQPFAEVGTVFIEEEYQTVPDREEILAELRRHLAEFSTLELAVSKKTAE